MHSSTTLALPGVYAIGVLLLGSTPRFANPQFGRLTANGAIAASLLATQPYLEQPVFA